MIKVDKDVLSLDEGLNKWNAILAYRGSVAHGMYVPNSNPNSIDDIDLMGICIPPKEYYLGLEQYGSRGTKEIKKGEWDIVVYEMKKFIALLAKGNPNVISMVWLKDDHYVHLHDAGRYLIANRELFLSNRIYESFIHYAKAQIYKANHLAFQGYMGEKRKALVNKFGFDCKNCAHCIRLLRMCIEFFNTGLFNVEREDAKELLEIKNGLWSLERITKEADRLFKLAEEAFLKTKFHDDVDMKVVNNVCVNAIEMFWGTI